MEAIKILIVASFSSLLLGQLVRLSLFTSNAVITMSDFFVLILDAFFLIYFLLIRKTLKLPQKLVLPATLFIISALSSLVLATNSFSVSEVIISSFFLARVIIYFFLAIVIYNTVEKQDVFKWVKLILSIGFVFTLIGLAQLIILPDLSRLSALGWDPHQSRSVSTLLDPNFSGAVLMILAAFSISLYLYRAKTLYLYLFILNFLALILTFSRSSYLAFLAVMVTIGILKSPKFLLVMLISMVFIFAAFAPVRSRVVGAFTVDETSRARIESWQNALYIFSKNSLFGVGFNTYRFAQSRYGFFSADQPTGGHSGAGTDSSFLLVAATTGVFGLIFFTFLLVRIFQVFKGSQSGYLSLASVASFSGLLVHSQFVNSFFFPQIMLLFWSVLGLALVSNDH